MYLSEKEVTLNLTSRPLRLVYLVGNREEFQNAVKLYTHIWGGLTNAIIPIHEDDIDIDLLKHKIILINPDFIFMSTKNICESIYTNLKEILPVKIFSDIDTEKIHKHIGGTELINLPHYSARSRHFTTKLSHIVYVLQEIYANPLPESHIWGIEQGNSFDFELSIQYGKISTMYRNYLTEHLAANFLRLPQNFEELVKSSLLLASNSNPILLTEIEIGKKQPLDNPIQQRMNCSSLLTIFLGDDQDIDIAAAYWNTRSWGLTNTNKLYLPKSQVLDNIERLTALIWECMPSITEILIVINTDIKEAENLAEQVYQAFVRFVPHFRVEVIYQNFHFFRGQAYSGNPINTTYIKFEDGSIRFSPPVPIGHQNIEFLFGWEAEVRLASSRRLLLPINKSSAVFLSNSQHQIEWADKNPDRSELFKGLSTRASSKGITGTISYKNDCCLYIPTDEMVISQKFKDAGLKIEINEHTRYAKGFIKRFGGFRKTIALVKNNGLGITKALERRTQENTRQVKQGGLKLGEIYEWLAKKRNLTNKEGRQIVKQQLPLLLSAGLVRRGYDLTCPHCNFKEWYAIERVQEFIDCVGCAESFQIPELEKIDFTYKLNELASHFLRSGGDAVLMTAAVLYKLMPYSWIQFGGNIHRQREKNGFAEIDVIGLEADTLVLAESKSYSHIEQQHLEQIKESLKKTIEVANLVKAQVVLLSITTAPSNSELHTLHTLVSEISDEAKDSGIGVHLAINGKLHPWGKAEETKLYNFCDCLEELKVDIETPTKQILSVIKGELPSQGFLSSQPLLDDEVMQRWRLELGANQASP
jgi:hypothetical protein